MGVNTGPAPVPAAPATSKLQTQEFTSSGTFTPPAGVTAVDVFAVGGGASGTAYSSAPGGGGPGGEVVRKRVPVTPGVGVTVTIGAGGAAPGAVSSSPQEYGACNAGGDTTFGSLVTAKGGLSFGNPGIAGQNNSGVYGAGGGGAGAGGPGGNNHVPTGGQASTTQFLAGPGIRPGFVGGGGQVPNVNNSGYSGPGGGGGPGVDGYGGGGGGGTGSGGTAPGLGCDGGGTGGTGSGSVAPTAGTANTGGGGGGGLNNNLGAAGGSGYLRVEWIA